MTSNQFLSVVAHNLAMEVAIFECGISFNSSIL